jgi:TolA-binding protein
MAMASNLESLKKTDEALALYQQIAATYPRSYTAPLALISQVPLLKEKRQPDVARRACETVVSQYGDSFWAGEAMRELRMLKPAATTSPAPVAPNVTPSAASPASARPSPAK